MAHIPVARGLIACDRVQVDLGSGNLTLVNCFDSLTSPVFPCLARLFSLVAFLCDGEGDLRMRVEIEFLDEGRVIYSREHDLRIPDRLRQVRYRYVVTGCDFPSPGSYAAYLYANRELVADTRFRLRHPEDFT
jgi:hypothetical protein